MANKLNVPSIVGMQLDGVPQGLIVYLQAVQDALNTVDNNAVYKDALRVNLPQPRIRALTSQGQSFSVSGVDLASGADFVAMRRDQQALLEDVAALREAFNNLVNKLQGE